MVEVKRLFLLENTAALRSQLLDAVHARLSLASEPDHGTVSSRPATSAGGSRRSHGKRGHFAILSAGTAAIGTGFGTLECNAARAMREAAVVRHLHMNAYEDYSGQSTKCRGDSP